MKLIPRLVLLSFPACLTLLSLACVESHTEKDKRTLLGGYKHEETTTTRNPLTGETKTTHEERKVE